MTSDQWARVAVELADHVGASEIAVEGFAARETYVRVVKDALRRYRINRPVRVSSWPPKASGRGGGDAIARSSALIQALEVGTTRIAGHLPDLELAAVQWQAGQHQPDALAALVVAHDVAVHSAGRQLHIATPDLTARLGDARRQPGATVTPLNSHLRRKLTTPPTKRRTGPGAGRGLPVGFGDTGLLDPAERR